MSAPKCWEMFAFVEKYEDIPTISDAITSRDEGATKNILISASREKRDTRISF